MTIFYDPRQNVDGLDSFSPSAGKPARFVKMMAHLDFRTYGESGAVEPVNRDDLMAVHDFNYVDGVFNGTINNGFENRDQRVPEAALWNIGSLLAAARFAMKHPPIVACSPTSGYHHAGHAYGGGFCTFNGLMVVAAKLIAEKPDLRIGILDCDFHYGDGTADILKYDTWLQEKILHITSGKHFHPGDDQLEFQAWLKHSIDDLNDFGCDLVLYQAGADMSINDPLGGLLTDAEMQARDRMVFRNVKAPIAWCLAGGYQKSPDGDIFTDPVLKLHRNTIDEANRSIAYRLYNNELPLRDRFHQVLEREGFAAQKTPEIGRTYKSSHVQTLWNIYVQGFRDGRNPTGLSDDRYAAI